MKLPQLPLGARFEYEGKTYVKTGPVTASSDAGGQRMIPRYAVLRPLDAVPSEKPPSGRTLDEDSVLAAFEDFYRHCIRVADDAGKAELALARGKFLAALRG